MLTQQTLHMNSEKKHSVRYDGHGNDPSKPVLRGIYVPKALLPRPFPSKLKVTLEVSE